MKNSTKFCSVALLLLSSSLISPWPSLVLAQNADVAGIWSLSAQGISVGCTEHTPCQTAPPYLCGIDICGSFQMGDPDIHVSQSGTMLTASEGDVNGNPFTLDGTISGDIVAFTIHGIGITPGIGPATTTYTGILNGDTVSGNLSGSASWSYQDASGNSIIETATWTGTFTVTIAKCDFSSEPSDPERCFGGIGTRCKGDAPGAPFRLHEDSCLVDGWMSVGSILHDRCCLLTNNAGYSCSGINQGDRRLCKQEWQEAWDNTQCTLLGAPRQWQRTFGPYPAGNTGDDTNQDFRAPIGARVNPSYQHFCPSGQCQVNSKGKTIIKRDQCGRYCECQ